MKREIQIFFAISIAFLTAYFLPIGDLRVQTAILDAFRMVQWYALYHTLGCVVPAMFIAGAIATFVRKESILKYLGPRANRFLAYGFASVGGTLLSVCSCSVLPMFAGIYRVGAGLGPAITFLCAGPALNVMAIFLSARVLGISMGFGRMILAILMSIFVGICMSFFFRKEEKERIQTVLQLPEPIETRRRPWQTGVFLATMLLFLIFSDWTSPGNTVFTIPKDAEVTHLDRVHGIRKWTLAAPVRLEVSLLQQTQSETVFQVQKSDGFSNVFPEGERFRIEKKKMTEMTKNVPPNYEWSEHIYTSRWFICGFLGTAWLLMIFRWFERWELKEWLFQTWSFSKMIIPLLLGGVFITGFVASLIPSEIVARFVGGNGWSANLVASTLGMLWYFSTLSEIPMLEALRELGMGSGPGMALLLAGPTLSLPAVFVLAQQLGWKKTCIFVSLIVIFATICGKMYGLFL